MDRWADLKKLRATIGSREEFARRLGAALLIALHELPSGGRGGYETSSTQVFDPFEAKDIAIKDPTIYRVEKRAGGPFEDMISVGRTRASDLCLTVANISKFHAYFSRSPQDGSYSLADAGSTNGTFVAGTRLERQQPCRLGDSADVAFAKATFRFFTPEGLYDYLGAVPGKLAPG